MLICYTPELAPSFFSLVTHLGISHNFRKTHHEHELEVIHGNTYPFCIPPSSWLPFNWLDNSPTFPAVRRAVRTSGAVSLGSDLGLVLCTVVSCIQPEIRFCLTWTTFKLFLSHYFKIVIFHIKIFISHKNGFSFKNRNMKQHWGQHSYLATTTRAWRQLPPLNACAPYHSPTQPTSRIYVTCLARREVRGWDPWVRWLFYHFLQRGHRFLTAVSWGFQLPSTLSVCSFRRISRSCFCFSSSEICCLKSGII